jgi:hypothetical protein
MKQIKCPICNKILDFGSFIPNLFYIECNSVGHYFTIDFKINEDNKIHNFYLINYIENKIDYLLEICSINNVLGYYFRIKNMSKTDNICLDNSILNHLHEKISNDELTEECILNIINKLQNLMLFL